MSGPAHLQRHDYFHTTDSKGPSSTTDLPPINRLPPELLNAIFALCRDAEPRHSWRPDRPVNVLLLITHVCRYWRMVALDHPLLWNRLSLDVPKWAEICLSRSKDAPLEWRGNHPFEEPLDSARKSLINRVLTPTPRLRYFQMRGSSRYLNSVIMCLKFHAPVLEAVDFSGIDKESLVPVDLAGLFKSEMPHLRRVVITNIDIAWSGGALYASNLTHLCLEGKIHSALEDVLQVLRLAPQLQVFMFLTLLEMSPNNHTCGHVRLDHLRLLHIEASLDRCVMMLAHILRPGSCRLVLSITHHLFYDEQVVQNLVHLSQLLDLASVRRLAIQPGGTYFPGIAFDFWNTVHPNPSESVHETIQDVAQISILFASVLHWKKLLSSFLETVSFGNVKQLLLHVHDDTLYVISHWLQALFGQTPGTEHVLLITDNFGHFCSLLCQIDEGGRPLLLPSLGTLHLLSIKFRQDTVSRDLVSLHEALRTRFHAGAGLKRLLLEECSNLDHTHVRGLKHLGVVDQVVWNGILT